MQKILFHGARRLALLTTTLAILAFISVVYYCVTLNIPLQSKIFLCLFSFATAVLLILRRIDENYVSFTTIFLLSTFTLITAWRLSVLAQLEVAVWLYAAAFALKVVNYLSAAYYDIIESKSDHRAAKIHNTRFEWQLLFIRMFVGYDLIPHFSEKLFAGAAIRTNDVMAFDKLHVPHAFAFVVIAGLCEFGGALAISCGLLTRLGAICLFVYLMVATYLGHHFELGFIWASPGGGWEFPVLWSVLILSFCVFGANSFSIDQVLKDRYQLPGFVKKLMG